MADRVVHEAVARIAADRPRDPALIHADRTIDFGTLNAAADAYAARLADRGVTRGDIVPLLMPRSPRTVALQLGVLKCGAAYAGLDRRWPRERLEGLLGWMRPRLLVVPDGDEAAEDVSHPVFAVPDEDLGELAARTPGPPEVSVSPEDAATVFFTSGTTGVPKGVMAPHQAVTRLFRPGGLPGFGPGKALPQAAPPAWDMYAFEVWGALTSGATSVLIDGDHLLPSDLRRAVRDHSVTTLWLTTALFNLFVDEDPECFLGLGHVFTGGEKLSPRHVEAFLRHHPGIPLFNGYGPAESAMLTTTRRILPEDCAVAAGIPLGAAVPGTRVVLLEPDGRPCPPGAPGEIWIAGEGLAIGYLHDPETTARQFRTIRLDDRDVRAYRTGDLGVADEDGTLHFRGRADRQLKISGHRIEPAEVENAARVLAGVQDCAVVPTSTPDGTVTGLALFYLCADRSVDLAGRGQDPLDVRAQLTRSLPAYLVPAVVHALDRFPVTANGKLDRTTLGDLARRLPRARRRVGSGPAGATELLPTV